jgi:hypothetical protein
MACCRTNFFNMLHLLLLGFFLNRRYVSEHARIVTLRLFPNLLNIMHTNYTLERTVSYMELTGTVKGAKPLTAV